MGKSVETVSSLVVAWVSRVGGGKQEGVVMGSGFLPGVMKIH